MFDGLVKTLHPNAHGGLLCRRDVNGQGMDAEVMAKHGIQPIDLLVVNLYPFEATVANPECTLADAIENIDIGGPAMVRSAAKNYESVVVIVDAEDYSTVVEELNLTGGSVSAETRFNLAVKAFEHVAERT